MKTLIFAAICIAMLFIFGDNYLHHQQEIKKKEHLIDSLERVVVVQDSTIQWEQRRSLERKRQVNFLNNYIADKENLRKDAYAYESD